MIELTVVIQAVNLADSEDHPIEEVLARATASEGIAPAPGVETVDDAADMLASILERLTSEQLSKVLAQFQRGPGGGR